MNTETNYASLFYDESQNDIDFLEKTVADFPVSSVARFLLLYHHKKNNLSGFDELAKQTGIYLNNPLWIQFQLLQVERSENKLEEILLPENQIEEAKLPTTEPEKEIAFDEKKEISESTESEDGQELSTIVNEQITEIPSLEMAPVDEENKEDVLQHSDALKEIKEEELSTIVNEQITEIPSSEIVPVDEENKEEILVPEIQSEENIDSTKETEEESSSEDEKNIIALNPDSSNEENLFEDKSVLDIKILEEEKINPEEEISKDEISNVDSDSENDEETISFEPLHTVDYFASQGIKINEEALANDHLGKQVKSFTAWLKSMKKLHPGQLPEQNEVIEKIIQSSSEASNKDAHVLTEAMAEVLLKQGKREKAVEMYEKLSLINPSKSAYFAAKIESLKII